MKQTLLRMMMIYIPEKLTGCIPKKNDGPWKIVSPASNMASCWVAMLDLRFFPHLGVKVVSLGRPSEEWFHLLNNGRIIRQCLIKYEIGHRVKGKVDMF